MRNIWTLLVASALLLIPALCLAQHEQDTWCFGKGATLWFPPNRSLAPQQVGVVAVNALEGSAALSDRSTGQLLFYTDGVTLWNAQNLPTPNGQRLMGHTSSTQSALFVPMPGNQRRYYLFTADCGVYMDPPNNGINYNILDLDTGDLVVRNAPLLPTATEKLTAIHHCNGRDYWVIAHGLGDNLFYAYRITPNGIDPPIISAVGVRHDSSNPSNAIGYLKSSSDGTRLACAINGQGIVEILRFDKVTGVISDPIDLEVAQPYGVSFSPSGRLLYAVMGHALVQFDLSSSDSATIAASRFAPMLNPATAMLMGGIQLGPNGIIYVAEVNLSGEQSALGIISRPDARGAGCSYTPQAQPIQKRCNLALPNVIDDGLLSAPRCIQPTAGISASRLIICAGDSIDFTDASINATRWQWTFPGGAPGESNARNPRMVRFPSPGNAIVTLVASNAERSDTTRVTVVVQPVPTADAGLDQTICPGDQVQLKGSGDGSYSWSPPVGLSCFTCPDPIASPPGTTTYHLLVTGASGCTAVDSVTVTVADRLAVDAGTPRTICAGESVQLAATGADGYVWSPATGLDCVDCPNPRAHPASTTTYTVQGTRGGCSGSDTVTVFVHEQPKISVKGDAMICAGDSARLGATGAAHYVWTPAEGLSCADCASPNASPSRSTTYVVTGFTELGCSARDTVRVTVHPYPEVTIADPAPICSGDSIDLSTTLENARMFRWSPAEGLSCVDCLSPRAFPSATTTYTLDAEGEGGCATLAMVTVTVLPRGELVPSHDTTICPGTAAVIGAAGAASYRWSPAESVECPTCASTIVHPTGSTTYVVDAIGQNGCALRDSVRVTVRPVSGPIRAHIPRDLRVKPGQMLPLPVILDDPIAGAVVTQVHLSLRVPSSLLMFRDVQAGQTVYDWKPSVAVHGDTIDVTLTAPAGKRLTSGGVLLTASFATFVGRTMEWEMPLDLRLEDLPCQEVIASPGHVQLDSICGLSFRLIELLPAKYAMIGVRPNPFNPSAEIRFSLGLDGQTSMMITDAAGRHVTTLLDEYLEPGEHGVTWDATRYPSGLYFYRIESGAWHAEGTLLLVK